MYCTKKPETNLLFGYGKAEEIKRQFLIPFWNIYSFFMTYASLDRWTPGNTVDRESLSLMDRWVLSKLNKLISDVTAYMDDFDPYNASISIEKFVGELSTWYVRRSRRRFWKSEKDEDKNAAYMTLYACLTILVKLLAPFITFVTEEMYQNLVRNVDSHAPESVHHNNWPVADEKAIDKELTEDMDLTIKVCGLGRSARSKAGIKLRQPLSAAKVFADKTILKRIRRFEDIIVDELNVKNLSLITQKDEIIEYSVKPLPQALGKKYGKLYPKIKEALTKLDAKTTAHVLSKGKSLHLKVDGQDIELLPEEVEVTAGPKPMYSLSEEEGIAVVVEVALPADLKKEGLARDIVRRIQNQRKEAGFNIADLIETYYEAGPNLLKVFKDFGEYIATETLSGSSHAGAPPKEAHITTYKIEGESLRIGIVRIKK